MMSCDIIPGFRFYPYKIGTSLRALRALAKFLTRGGVLEQISLENRRKSWEQFTQIHGHTSHTLMNTTHAEIVQEHVKI